MRREDIPFSVVLIVMGVAMIAIVIVYTLTRSVAGGIPSSTERQVMGGSPEMGAILLEKYGCGACHTVAGVRSANGQVGPPLNDLAERAYIAGVLPNTPENLVRWIQFPQAVAPNTAMPDLDVSESDARDIAAYLYALE